MLNAVRQDLKAVFDRDPAATSKLEVIFTYAGFHALMAYRLAHWLKSYGIPFVPRAISQLARWLTGVEMALELDPADAAARIAAVARSTAELYLLQMEHVI